MSEYFLVEDNTNPQKPVCKIITCNYECCCDYENINSWIEKYKKINKKCPKIYKVYKKHVNLIQHEINKHINITIKELLNLIKQKSNSCKNYQSLIKPILIKQETLEKYIVSLNNSKANVKNPIFKEKITTPAVNLNGIDLEKSLGKLSKKQETYELNINNLTNAVENILIGHDTNFEKIIQLQNVIDTILNTQITDEIRLTNVKSIVDNILNSQVTDEEKIHDLQNVVDIISSSQNTDEVNINNLTVSVNDLTISVTDVSTKQTVNEVNINNLTVSVNDLQVSVTDVSNKQIVDAENINNLTISLTDVSNKQIVDEANIIDLQTLKASIESPIFSGVPTVPTANANTNNLQIANTSYVDTAIASLVGTSPTILDTLQEINDAINNDANFSTTIINSLSTKAPIENPTFTTRITTPAVTLNGTDLQGSLNSKANKNNPEFTGTMTTFQNKTISPQAINNDAIFNNYVDFTSSGQTQITSLKNLITNKSTLDIFSVFGVTLENFGLNWKETTIAKNWLDIAISSSGKYQTAVSSDTKTMYQSSDYGVTWDQNLNASLPNNTSFRAIAISGTGQYQSLTVPYHFIVSGNEGIDRGIYLSSDFGKTWSKATITTTNNKWYSIAMSESGAYQLASNGYELWETANFGSTWNKYTNIPNTSIVPTETIGIVDDASNKYIAISSSGQYRTVLSNKNVYNSSDYGISWSVVKNNFSGGTSVAMSSSGQYQTILYNRRIIVSNDYGRSWNESIYENFAPGSIPHFTVTISASGLYQAIASPGDGSCILYSANFGQSFYKLATNPISNFVSVAISSNGQILAGVGYQGFIYNCVSSMKDPTKADIFSPSFKGTPTVPDAGAGTNTTQIANTKFVTTGLSVKAPILSPIFTGTPQCPTAIAGTNSDQVANTKYVDSGLSTKADTSALSNYLTTSSASSTYASLSSANTFSDIINIAKISEKITSTTPSANSATCTYDDGALFFINTDNMTSNFTFNLIDFTSASNRYYSITLIIYSSTSNAYYANNFTINGSSITVSYVGGQQNISIAGASYVIQQFSLVYTGSPSAPQIVFSSVKQI